MTVKDLIEELNRLPAYLPVKVMLSEVYGVYDETGQFRDDAQITLTADDAIEADPVTHEGNFILVRSK